MQGLERWLQAQNLYIREKNAVTGGCCHQAYLLTLNDGQQLFIKLDPQAEAQQFQAEAAGLEILAASSELQVPEVYFIDRTCLAMTYLPPGTGNDETYRKFGESLARQHQQRWSSQGTEGCFGFSLDTYCGLTRQPNTAQADGFKFYQEQRYLYIGALCRDKGLLSQEDMLALEVFCRRLPDLVPQQPAVLLHGDLWSGNLHITDDGLPALIDPAAYYGWAEAELAMTTLFGAFPDVFYRAYEAEVKPEIGWRQRVDIYNLWHLLNHLYLFGESYKGQCMWILNRFS